MATLLLRLDGPMQAWGDESKFEYRRTRREPTKSGVIGLLASALGYSRSDDRTGKLTRLRFGVRIDREGTDVSQYDYQLARVCKKGKNGYEETGYGEYKTDSAQNVITYRYYLYDASFLAGVEGDQSFLNEIADAICHPMWPLFLGRRSCPPAKPVLVGIRDLSLEDALKKEPLEVRIGVNNMGNTRRCCIEPLNESKDCFEQHDNPVSFDKQKRIFGMRKVQEFHIMVESGNIEPEEHDPMALL